VVVEEPDRIHHHRHQGPYPDGGEGGGAKKVGTGPSTSPRSAVVEACVEHTENMTLGEEHSGAVENGLIFNSTRALLPFSPEKRTPALVGAGGVLSFCHATICVTSFVSKSFLCE
jgi:hypothetical protein